MTSANQLRPIPGSEAALCRKTSLVNLAGVSTPASFFREHEITEPWPALRKIDVLRCCLFLPRGSDTDGRRSSSLIGAHHEAL